MASTRPSRGSIATSAAEGSVLAEPLATVAGEVLESRSIVVVTLSPPPNTSAAGSR